jgi:hypothetical protein
MTIGFPGDRVWNAANWVVRGFCHDARPHLAEFPLLAERVERNFLTELWSFDVRDDPFELEEMYRLVLLVLTDNERTRGAGWQDPSWFPVYLGKLRDLAELVRAVRLDAAPDGAPTVDGGRVVVDAGLYLAFGQGLFRGHLAADPQQKRLVTQAHLHETTAAEFARRWALAIDGIAPLEYAGPVDGFATAGWTGDCIVEVEPRGEPAIDLAPIGERAAVELALELLAVVERAHAAGQTIGGVRPELIYARRDPLHLTGLAPRSPMFLARSYPLSSGNPPFTRLYTAVTDPPLEPPGDVYAAALTFIHLIQGAHPYGEHYLEQLPRMAAGQAPPWRGSPALGEALASALEPDPARRPSAAELAARLAAL